MCALYKLDFASGKSYVGITTGSARARFKGHLDATRQGSKLAVHSAWRKYGAPKMTVLALLERNALLDAERRAVSVFGTLTPSGYNMIPGGAFNPMMMPESVAKLSLAKMGHEVSVAARAKISAAQKGRKASDETRAKLSAAHKGKPLSADHIEKLRGRIVSADTRARIGAIHKGKKISEEHKARLRGRIVSAETRARQSVSQLKRHATKEQPHAA